MSDQSRLDDLRRRVEADPTSIAFAALAEEYRRAGRCREAVAVCRQGLTRHPAYLSARVTLGLALLDLEERDIARAELERVLEIAPENLAAIRALADLRERGTPPQASPVAANDSAPKVESTPSNPALVSLDRLLSAIVTLRGFPVCSQTRVA